MAESLRHQQRRLARELILGAAADEIVEHGLEQLSLQAVADRAGVAKRTLYNHFDSREMLLTALGEYSDQLTIELGGSLMPTGLDELPDTVARVWTTWAAQGTVYEAMMRISAATNDGAPAPDRERRHDAIAAAVREVRPDLDDAAADEIASLLHGLGSPNLYQRLHREDGVPIDRAGALAGWAIGLVRDALCSGRQPFPKEDPT